MTTTRYYVQALNLLTGAWEDVGEPHLEAWEAREYKDGLNTHGAPLRLIKRSEEVIS